jgi:tetratricopeptide (TPR) repeat protein
LRNLALSLVWGDLPMIDADPQGTGSPYDLRLYDQKILEYSRRIVEARSKYAYHYLVEGVMLRPPLVTPNPQILIPGASRIPYSGVNVKPFYSDSVFASAWLAPDKSIGIVITSIAPYQLNITIPLGNYSVPQEEDLVVYIIINGEVYSSFQTKGIPREVKLSLAPYDVALIVISPHSSLRAKAVEELQEAEYKLRTLDLPRNSTLYSWLNLAIFKFKNNDFEESLNILVKLVENITTISLLIEQIHALNTTTIKNYVNASTPALRGLLDNASKLLEEALLEALNLNFTASEMLINASKEKLSGFYTLQYLTLEAQNTLNRLLQTLYTLNETITSIEGREILERLGKLLGEAEECINKGEVERAMQLLSEAKPLIKEAVEKSAVKTITVTMERTITTTETSPTTITSLVTIQGGVTDWNRVITFSLILLIIGIIVGRLLGKKK